MNKVIQAAIVTTLILFFLRFLYYRYYPVKDLEKLDLNDVRQEEGSVLDIRDFNVSYKDPIPNAVNMPLSYLSRYCTMLNCNCIIIVSSDKVGVNMCARLLKRKGFRVIGYSIRKNMKDSIHYSHYEKGKREVAS